MRGVQGLNLVFGHPQSVFIADTLQTVLVWK